MNLFGGRSKRLVTRKAATVKRCKREMVVGLYEMKTASTLATENL